MKNVTYEFTEADVQAVIFCLKLIPYIDFQDTPPSQQFINASLAASALQKLENREISDITPNEVRMMSVAIDIAYMTIRNSCPYPISSEANTNFAPYIFTINKLYQSFSSQLNEF